MSKKTSEWREAPKNNHLRDVYHGNRNRVVRDVRIKQDGLITFVALQVDDEDGDCSHLGEYAHKVPDYPYFDLRKCVLVLGTEEITFTKVELYRRNLSATEWQGDIPPGGRRYCAELEVPHGGTIQETEQKLLADEWEPKGYAAQGLEPEFEDSEESEDKPVAYGYNNVWIEADGNMPRHQIHVPYRDTDYEHNPETWWREAQFIHNFQHQPDQPDKEFGFQGCDPKSLQDTIVKYGSLQNAAIGYCIADALRLKDYGNGWSMCGIVVKTYLGADEDGNGGDEIEIGGSHLDSLWGIESDSDDDYFWDEVAEDCTPAREDVLKALEQTAQAYAGRAVLLAETIERLKSEQA